MTSTIKPVDAIDNTGAAHLTLTKSSTATDDALTMVWSTLPVRCECRQPGSVRVEFTAGKTPMVWDTSGVGTWQVVASKQCPGCGGRVGVPAELVDGHIDGAELRRLSEQVHHDALAATEAQQDRMRRVLQDDLDQAEQDLITGYKHLSSMPNIDEMMSPGIGVAYHRGVLVAWDWDPTDRYGQDMIEVERPIPPVVIAEMGAK